MAKYELKIQFTFHVDVDDDLTVHETVAYINELIQDEAELMISCQVDQKLVSLMEVQ